MTALLLRAGALAGIYLLVLTSVAPGDLLIGGLLGLTAAYALRPRAHTPIRRAQAPAHVRLAAATGLFAATAVETVRGIWRVARFCLGAPAKPGLVQIPRAGRSRIGVGLWGVLTGEAPDEVPVEVDEERDVLIVHLVDASDPAAVRARHARSQKRWLDKVVS